MDRERERAADARFAAGQPRLAARHQQPRRDDAGPGRDTGGAGRRLVGAAIEVACAARQRVQHHRAVGRVLAGQQQRRISGPEQQPPAPQVRPPRRLGQRVGVDREPSGGDLDRDRRGRAEILDHGEIAQPGEALQVLGHRRRDRERREVQRRDVDGFAMVQDPPVQHRRAGAHVAGDGIVRDRQQLQRIAATQPQAVQRRAPGEAMEADRDPLDQRHAFAGRADQAPAGLDAVPPGHRQPPFSAAMLAA